MKNKMFRYGLLLLVLFQFPFVYQVCNTWEVVRYREAQQAERRLMTTPFRDLRGGLHVHSAAGGHSLGTYPEIFEAAKSAGYDYLMLTEHPRQPQLYNPIQDSQLIVILGWELPREDGARELTDSDNRLRVYSEFEGESIPDDVNAVEIFNLAESAMAHNNLIGWISWFYHRPFFKEEFTFQIWELNRARVSAWDRATYRRRLSAVAGNDAHQNLGIILTTAADQRLFEEYIDPYRNSLQFVTNHLQLAEGPEPTADAVIGALASGASYICFEQISDPTGFSFHALTPQGVRPMGSEVTQASRLEVQAPMPVRFRILQNGRSFQELEGRRFTVPLGRPGVYRVEVLLLNPPSLLQDKPWIITNPIYVRAS